MILSEVSEPHELLSLISLPFPVLRPARGEAGGALLAAQTMLWMCSQILLNRRMFPATRGDCEVTNPGLAWSHSPDIRVKVIA